MNHKINAEEYLDHVPMWVGKKHSLDEIRLFLAQLGNPQEKQRVIHVAGTNGKGSVCAFITSVLRKSGFRVGTFLSPHLWDIRERFLIDGELVGREAFEESFLRIFNLSRMMEERGFSHPSYFEFLFYMGLDLFEKEGTEYTVLETGLGGRLDATNCVSDPLVTVITSISLDHTQYLGDTIEKIAGEKAGIIKPGVPVIYDGQDERAAGVIRARGKELSSPLYQVDRLGYELHGLSGDGIWAGFLGLLGDVRQALVPFQAEYQVMNALVALRALEVLSLGKTGFHLSQTAFQEGFGATKWPGRMEEAAPGLFLDGAHNPGGAEEFARAAGRLCRERGKRACLLFAASKDKAHEAMIRIIANQVPLDRAAVTSLMSGRGESEAVLLKEMEAACGCPVLSFPTAALALTTFLTWKDEEHLLFCVGSLYLIGELRSALGLSMTDRRAEVKRRSL